MNRPKKNYRCGITAQVLGCAAMNIEKQIRARCESAGILTAYQLQVAAGLSPTLAYSLFNETFNRISIETMGKLCEALKCEPGDLFTVANGAVETKPAAKKRAGRKAGN